MKSGKFLLKFFILSLVFIFINCEDEKKHFNINYLKIIRSEYTFGSSTGKIIPLTLEQSIETDGDISGDGLFFFYSSDRERGNYDIYLRDLTDITTVRITQHPSKDTSPAISPNGKYLAFISQREDPEGDLYIVKVNPKKMIESSKKSVTALPSLDERAKNITQFQDPVSKTIKIIKDASPCWSPRGDLLTFSSTRSGEDNIWIVDPEGKNFRQITKKGGMYPRFSPDGNNIIFISYREKNSNGDVYIININSGKEQKITSGKDIELTPSFMGNNYEIFYTLINRDTNGNNSLDLKDNSVIFYRNLKTGETYPLTLYSKSSFSAKWFPVFLSKEYKGIILFSDQIGHNINLNIIPDFGIIPRKNKAVQQFDLAPRYLREYDDIEKYVACLERVYQFFGNKKDMISIIYVSKSLVEAARMYYEYGYNSEALQLQKILSSYSKDDKDFRTISAKYLNELLQGRDGTPVLAKYINELKGDSARALYLPFLMEELGDAYSRRGRLESAINTYGKILRENEKYERIIDVHYKYGTLSYGEIKQEIHPSLLAVLMAKKADVDLNVELIKYLLKVFDKEKDVQKKIAYASGMIDKYKDVIYIPAMLNYITGSAYYRLGNIEEAKKYLLKSQQKVRKENPAYYYSNVLLAKISSNEGNYDKYEKHLKDAIRNYQKIQLLNQSQYKSVITELINYYEEFGEKAEQSGDLKKAVKLYSEYVELLSFLHRKKRYEDIYNDYSARAHILYIDTYLDWKGNSLKSLKELEYQYAVGKSKDRLLVKRYDFDKIHIYGLGYIYTKMAVLTDNTDSSVLREVMEYFKQAMEQIEWALFIDDTFIDPYLLKGWIYQYVDLKRSEDEKNTGGKNEGDIARFFPKYLLESNIPIYERAINANDESKDPESEGNLYINMANTYFLLNNFPRALSNYKIAEKLKRNFNSNIEEAIFHFHLGYSYWQNDEFEKAREEMKKALFIYETLASQKNIRRYKHQIYYLYRYFALFDRLEKNYKSAIKWYNKIIDFTDTNKIEIDRARYMQEIGYCYKETGEIDYAISYLDKAQNLLKKYKDTKKEYNLKIKLFSLLGPFSVWDLGPDAAVIGGNKLYYELDTYNKQLLNMAIQEEIYFKEGNYAKTIVFLKKKLELLENSERKSYAVNKEGKIRTLNNIGYCYYKLNNYREAAAYFKEAWDYAADPDVSDLQGIFKSIMNATNIFVFQMENKLSLPEDLTGEIDRLIEKISNYKNSYEKKRFEDEYKGLKKEAELKKREITAQEESDLQERIRKDAGDIYYTLDIALGILKYYKAENLVKDKFSFKDKSIDEAFGFYKSNKEIYDLYSSAATKFESSLEKAGSMSSKKLKIKLLLNLASCQKRIFALEDAYETLSSAEETAKKYRYDDLLWEVYFNIAVFLKEYGKVVEGPGYISLTNEYFVKSLELVERTLHMYPCNIHRLRSFYDQYIKFLIDSGRYEQAFIVSERKNIISRAVLIKNYSPNFYNKVDKENYDRSMEIIDEIKSMKSSITSSLEEGGAPDSDKNKELNNLVIQKEKILAESMASFKSSGSMLSSYFKPGLYRVPVLKDSVIYKFQKIDGKLYSWRIQSGKAVFKKLVRNEKDKSDFSIISKYLNDDKTGADRYIVLNDTILKSLMKTSASVINTPFMYISSSDRIEYYLKANNTALSSVLYTGNGLKDALSSVKELSGIEVSENIQGTSDLSKYSIIVERAEDKQININTLFSNRLEPSLVIKVVDKMDIDDISLLTEASLYAGIKSIVITYQSDLKTIAGIIGASSESSYNKINSLYSNPASHVLGIGFKGYNKNARSAKSTYFKKQALREFRSNLKKGNLELARMYLNQWHELTVNDRDKNLDYRLHLSRIEVLSGNYKSAVNNLDIVIKDAAKGPFAKFQKAVLYKIYINFYEGNVSKAGDLLDKYKTNKNLAETKEFELFRSILKLANEDAEGAKNPFLSSGKKSSILSENMLRLLYAEYLNLLGQGKNIKEILANWKQDYPLSDRDIIKASLLKERSQGAVASERARGIIGLINSKLKPSDIKTTALYLAEAEGKYDALSSLALQIAVREFMKINRMDLVFPLIENINITEMSRSSFWNDFIPMLNLINNIYSINGKNEDTIKGYELLVKEIRNKQLKNLLKKFLYKEAEALLRIKKYPRSYNIALEGRKLLNKKDRLNIKYQMLLLENEVYTGREKESAETEASIEKGLSEEYLYVLYLFKAYKEKVRILKLSSEAGKGPDKNKEAVEKGLGIYKDLIEKSVKILDKSPLVLRKNNRIDLVNQGLDFLISYRMSRSYKNKTNEFLDALVLAEVKKQLNLRAKFPYEMYSGSLPVKAVDEFKSISNDRDGMKKFVALLREYPFLQIGATVRTIPFSLFQETIPGDAVVFYIIRNAQDILIWVIDKSNIIPMRLGNAYKKAEGIIKKYRELNSQLKNTVTVSRDLYRLFNPDKNVSIEKYYKDKKLVVFITDDDMEKIPYGLSGKNEILEETHSIVYLSSILSSLRKYNTGENVVNLVDTDENKIYHVLEKVAIRESGIKYDKSGKMDSGIAHLLSSVLYNPARGDFFMDNKSYYRAIRSPELVYLPAVDFIEQSGYNDFTLYNSFRGVEAVIINNSDIHDINNALFIDTFYRELSSEKKLISSFRKAKDSVRRKDKYRHPSYWAGIRLYLNKL